MGIDGCSRIEWEKMGLRYQDFFPHLMGSKATARAHRLYERAKEKLISRYNREGKRIPIDETWWGY